MYFDLPKIITDICIRNSVHNKTNGYKKGLLEKRP